MAWLGYSAAADALHYVRWDHGELQRELAWGFLAPGGWDRVAGPPEPWESGRPGYNLLPVRLERRGHGVPIARHHRFADPGQESDPTDLFPIGWCAGDEDDETEETTHPRGRCAECGALVRGPCPRCETLAVRPGDGGRDRWEGLAVWVRLGDWNGTPLTTSRAYYDGRRDPAARRPARRLLVVQRQRHVPARAGDLVGFLVEAWGIEATERIYAAPSFEDAVLAETGLDLAGLDSAWLASIPLTEGAGAEIYQAGRPTPRRRDPAHHRVESKTPTQPHHGPNPPRAVRALWQPQPGPSGSAPPSPGSASGTEGGSAAGAVPASPSIELTKLDTRVWPSMEPYLPRSEFGVASPHEFSPARNRPSSPSMNAGPPLSPAAPTPSSSVTPG